MSSPPEYTRVYGQGTDAATDHGEDSSLLKHLEEGHLGAQSGPTYPPRRGEGSGSERKIVNVSYTFAPEYPVKGNTEHALGVLGQDKEVSLLSALLSVTSIKPSADTAFLFPALPITILLPHRESTTLHAYSPRRRPLVSYQQEMTQIVQRAFPVLANYPIDRIEFLVEVPNGGWGRILDEAWDHMEANPPSRLRVQVIDGPGDARARIIHHSSIAAAFAIGVILLLVGIGVLSNKYDREHGKS